MIEALFADDDKLFFEGDFVNVTFSSHEICILSVDLNNIKLDDANFYDDDPNVKHFKKISKESIPVQWQDGGIKRNKTIFL